MEAKVERVRSVRRLSGGSPEEAEEEVGQAEVEEQDGPRSPASPVEKAIEAIEAGGQDGARSPAVEKARRAAATREWAWRSKAEKQMEAKVERVRSVRRLSGGSPEEADDGSGASGSTDPGAAARQSFDNALVGWEEGWQSAAAAAAAEAAAEAAEAAARRRELVEWAGRELGDLEADTSLALLAALDTREVKGIQDAMARYADAVQGVQLQSVAFELVARVREIESRSQHRSGAGRGVAARAAEVSVLTI